MIKRLGFMLTALAMSTICLAQPAQQFVTSTPQQGGFSEERLLFLDKFLQGMVDNGQAPNVVTFVAHHGKVVHHKAYGYRNLEKKEPLRKDDIFRMASQTKAITSIAVMMLFEEGKFLLEDPISTYIPAFKNPQVLISYDPVTKKFKTRAAKSEITIRQLLSHTAGIPYANPLPGLAEFGNNFRPATSDQTVEQAVLQLAKRPLIADPGKQFVYGPNTDVLGYLVEILSGMSLAEFLKQRIFIPLGMTDTYFYLPHEKAGRLVELYSQDRAGAPFSLHEDAGFRNFAVSGDRPYYLGGAGLVGSIEDYGRFCQMIVNGGTFNGKQIVSRKTIELMSRNAIGELDVRGRQDKFGLGFQIITDKSLYGDQASPGSLTWGGMFSTEYTIDPKEDLILLVYTNVDPFYYETELERKFRILVYQALK